MDMFEGLPGDMKLADLREFVARLSPTLKGRMLEKTQGYPALITHVFVVGISWPDRTMTVREFGDTGLKVVSWISPGVIPRPNKVYTMLKFGDDSLILGEASSTMFSTPDRGRAPSVSLYRTTGHVVVNDVVTPLSWQAQKFDTDTMWDVGDPTKIWFVTPGLYIVGATLEWPVTGTGDVRRILDIRLNGTTFIEREENRYILGPSTHVMAQRVSRLTWFSELDYIEFCAFQSATGALTLPPEEYRLGCWAMYHGPEL
jgi:hypothetical protein